MQQSPCNPDTVALRGCLRSVATNRAATVKGARQHLCTCLAAEHVTADDSHMVININS